MYAIRPAADEDGPALSRLIAGVFAEYEGCPFHDDEFPELAHPATHYRGRGGGLWVLAPEDDPAGVVGSIGLTRVDDGATFELHKVYLDAGLRGRGLAARMYAHALAEAEALGAEGIRLWTDTRFSSGHRFYEKLGFRRLPVSRFLADSTNAWEYAYVRGLPR